MTSSDEETLGDYGVRAARHFVSDVYRATGIVGYPFRASPARTAAALRLAKVRLYHGLWHEWTAADQVRLEGWRAIKDPEIATSEL